MTHTLSQLAKLTGSTLEGDPAYKITGVDSLEDAGEEDVSFLANPRYSSLLHKTHAGAIFIPPQVERIKGKNFLISENPSLAFQTVMKLLLLSPDSFSGFKGIHPTALIHPTAIIGKNVEIGPYVVIDQKASIGDDTVLEAHTAIGPGVHVGTSCHFHPHVTVREKCRIGNRVILQPGAVIGSCGFGFNTDATGVHTKLEQLGIVVIEDDVEVGANTTIDRARFKTTLIGKGTKIDNLVQIGHNVQMGRNNIIVSQAGIAGSVKTGTNVVLGGQTGVVGHIEIASGVMVASRGGISKTMKIAGKYAGAPVLPLAEHNVQQVHLRKITTYVKQIHAIEKRLQALEERLQNE